MLRYDFIFIVLALIPLAVAITYRLAIVPRRSSTVKDTLQLALDSPETERKQGQHAYLEKGTLRVRDDFESQYTFRLLAPATLISFLYLVALPLCFARVLQHPCYSDWLLYFPKCLPAIPSYDFLLYAVIGAYVFNLGVLVRRTFLADVTEHVYWGAINRLLLTCGIALAIHGILGASTFGTALFFIIAFMPRVFITYLRKAASKILTDDGKAADELPIQLVQGIDIWKEQRLEEEGIESIENLATSDILTLAVKTHYPIRTLIDWIDQAILIQRFPAKVQALRDSGLAISAIDFAWMSPANNSGSKTLAGVVAAAISLNPDIVAVAMDSMFQDTYINILWTLWQNEGTDSGHPSP
jgi:hypothetical protein